MNNQASRLIELLQHKKINELKNAKVVSVASGKGGTGKTFFSSNFAYTLSKLNKKVLLVDFDFNLSNLNILLNQTIENSITDFFEQRKSLDEIIKPYTSNLHLIYGDSGKEYYPRLSKEIINYFFISLNKISYKYDFVIIDSSAGASEITLYQLLNSDYNVIVTSPEPTSIMDAYVLIKLLNSENSSSLKLVVVNKSISTDEGKEAFQNLFTACNHFLKEKPNHLGTISFDLTAHKSIMNQELLCECYSDSIVTKEIYGIAKEFIEIVQMANNNQLNLTSGK